MFRAPLSAEPKRPQWDATARRALSLVALLASLGCAQLAGVEDGQLASAGGAGGNVGGAGGNAGASGGGGGAPPDSGTGGGPADPYAAAVLADGPIAYFRFAETTGAVAKNEVAGSALTATYPVGGATRGVAGIRPENAAVRFDDVNTTLPVLGALDFPGDVSFSLEFWIQVADLTASGRFFEHMTSGSGKSGTWAGLWKTDKNRVRTETWADGTHLLYTLSATAPPQGQFVHVVFMHRAGDRDYLYVNGAEGEGSRLAVGDRVSVASSFQFVGFLGVLDEFAVYDKALSSAQIASHLTAQSK